MKINEFIGKCQGDSIPSLFIFAHDFRRIIKTRRGGAARRPNGGSKPFCIPSLCLRRKRAQKSYILAPTAEVKLQVMEEPPPFGPAQHLPARSGTRLPGPDGRVNLSGAQGGNPFSSPSRPGSVHQRKFIHLLKSEGDQVLFTDGLFVQCMQKFKDKETIKNIFKRNLFIYGRKFLLAGKQTCLIYGF